MSSLNIGVFYKLVNYFLGLFYKLVYYSVRKCSYAWPLFKLSLVSFSPLNTYIARYARVRRTEIYCAIARKLSHPTPNRVPSSLLEWPRCEGGRLVKLIYRTPLNGKKSANVVLQILSCVYSEANSIVFSSWIRTLYNKNK